MISLLRFVDKFFSNSLCSSVFERFEISLQYQSKSKFQQVWDYESKSCVQTLEGHGNNVTAVCVHPELPVIITASEDNTVKIWDAVTYR